MNEGGGHVAYSLFAEYLPTSSKNTLLTSFQLFWSFGVIMEAAIGNLLETHSWRFFLGISAIPSGVLSILFFFLPESPKYLSLKGEREKVVKCLNLVSHFNRKPLPPGQLVLQSQIPQTLPLSTSTLPSYPFESPNKSFEEKQVLIGNDFPSINSQVVLGRGKSETQFQLNLPTEQSFDFLNKKKTCWQKAKKFQLFELFSSREMAGITILLWLVWFANVFSYWGISILDPNYFAVKNQSIYFNTFITALAELPGVVFSIIAIKYVREKIVLVALFLIFTASTLLLAFSFPYWLQLIFALLSRGSIAGSFSVMMVFTVSLYPTQIRTTGNKKTPLKSFVKKKLLKDYLEDLDLRMG